ncbi:suppressor of fused homolog [Gigantopelta aegis]|uniref:suppressor of fused homolog n=1 Tax=Gigantopelta aegis TaxID=1735272 RepID=UPI001B88B6CA|nr:suppressor of fused homolog [Gigantopelta aegis]
MEERRNFYSSNYSSQPTVPITPPGLEAIYSACRRLYPNQPNPLQVTALVKYWLGGPDPLDYISMYSNPGDDQRNIPPHWHYISFGLSDLHGDGRVHESSNNNDGPSGFGFELTFRLRREPGETNPPTWPAALMQSLARYVFQSENVLCSGDHVSWHTPLDGSESRVQHMLMTEDVQLQPITTSFGVVNFVQIVGVCSEELKAAQHWNGPGVIELLRSKAVAGGAWLVTDMRRGETVFEMDPTLQDRVDHGIETEGSNLSGVSSKCSWEELGDPERDDDKENRYIDRERRGSNNMERRHISDFETEQIKATLKKGLSNTRLNVIARSDKEEESDNQNASRKESFDSTTSSEGPTELIRTRSLDAVHMKFNLEAGSLLPLALRGRLKHGRHFTFKSVLNDVAITLVSSSVIGSIADEEHPFAAHGSWLQILVEDEFIDDMLQDVEELAVPDDVICPKTYSWPERRLCITILPDEN